MQSNISHALEKHILNNNPLVACESPFQERWRFFPGVAHICHKLGKNCYLWNLGESAIKKVSISVEGNLALQDFDAYQPIMTGQKREEYANIFYFWQTQLENAVLIVENIYPWLQAENVANQTEFLLMSEWLKRLSLKKSKVDETESLSYFSIEKNLSMIATNEPESLSNAT